MGQTQSTPHTGTRAAAHHKPDETRLADLRNAQLSELTAQLARLADTLSLVDAAHANAVSGGGSGVLDVSAADATATTAALLQPFTEVHLAGYQLGNSALLHALTVAPDQPPCTPLSLLSRNTALTVLDLSYNHLTVDVVEPLLAAVGQLPVLTVLRLSGNSLGSAGPAAQGEEKSEDELHLNADDGSTGEEKSTTAAAQLGRWLASGPALQELALFQCCLNDHDVLALLRGLVVAPKQHTSTTSALTTLRLAGNPACTWRSAALALELVTETGRNEMLRVVELEGAPPGTDVRLEYACTPAGHFHSGATLIAAVDARGVTQEVSAEDMRGLTPGQAARFRARRRHLRDDLDGTRVMLPALMRQLRDILSTRQAADAAAKEEMTTQTTEVKADGTPYKKGAVADAGASLLDRANAVAAAVITALEATRSDVQGEDKMENEGGDAASMQKANGAEERGAASPPASAAAPRNAHSAGSASLLTNPPLFLTSRHARSSPQERRSARFEAPQRLAQVMADAVAFRRHIHPMQVDTHAPTCSDVHTRSTNSQYGSESSASTWFAKEGFVLRANGMTRVLVAPVLSGSAAPRQNVALEDVEDHPLQACWCTPRNTTNAATYAGALHYHCVREGDPVRHNGGATARVRRAQRKKAEGTSAAAGRAVLPPLGGAAAADHQPAAEHARSGNGRAYLACCGTGHTCLSSPVIAGGTLRTQRMRTTLLTQSLPRAPFADLRPATSHRGEASSAGRVGSSAAAGRVSRQLRGASAPSSASSSSRGTAPAVTMFGGAKTVLTTSSGVSGALNYSPVAFFASPHVACAAGIEVKECT